MVSIFYRLQFNIGCNKICTLWNKIISAILSELYPLYCKINTKRSGLNSGIRKHKITVSLTSFPNRIDKVYLCIESLLRQKCRPDGIILWLAKSQFQNVKIPKKLLDLCEFGFEIRYCDEDLGPHKKLYYSLKEYQDDVVITVDDDVIYSEKLIEKLYGAYLLNHSCVCCTMAHEITLDKNDKPLKYDNWNGNAIGIKGPSHKLVAIGVGGILYPPSCFDDEYFDLNLIRNMCLSTDDLWLKFTEIRLEIKVFKVDKYSKIPITIRDSQKIALTKVNNGKGKNDIAILKLCDYYHFDWSLLK